MHTLASRRAFLRACAAAPAALVLAACANRQAAAPTPAPATAAPAAAPSTTAPAAPTPAPTAAPVAAAQPTTLPATPACGDDDEPTIAQTEGPYFTPNSPARSSLIEPGMAGTPMVLSGFVLTTACAPVARALIDVWHADDAGAYDNSGFRLRGHLFSDDQGRYRLETIVPGRYPGRTRHFHIKVQAPGGPVLTTQLYFPDEPQNASDGIFSPELLMDVQEAADGSRQASFTFVLAA